MSKRTASGTGKAVTPVAEVLNMLVSGKMEGAADKALGQLLVDLNMLVSISMTKETD